MKINKINKISLILLLVLILGTCLVFGTPVFGGYLVIKRVLFEILVIFLFLLWLFSNDKNCTKPYLIFLAPLSLWLSSQILALFFAANKPLAIWNIYLNTLLFLFYLLVARFFSIHNNYRKVILWLLICTLLPALYGLGQKARVLGLAPDLDGYGEAMFGAFFGHANYAAEFLIGVIPFAWVLLFSRKFSWKWRIWGFLSGIVLLRYLVITSCRGAWLAGAIMWPFTALLAISGSFYLGRRKFFSGRKILTYFFLILVSLYIFLRFLPGEFYLKFSSITDFSDKPILTRIFLWQSSLEMIRDHALAGLGPGHFLLEYPSYRKSEERIIIRDDLTAEHAHNDYLETTVENGFIGFFALIWLLTSLFWRNWNLYNPRFTNSQPEITLGGLMACGAILFQALLSYPLKNPASAMLFWFLLGLIDSTNGKHISPLIADKSSLASFPKSATYKTWLKIFGVIFGIWGLILAMFHLIENYHLKKAELLQRLNNLPEVRSELLQAIRINPFNYRSLLLMGNVLSHFGVHDKALWYTQKSLHYFQNNRNAWYNLGLIWTRLNKLEQAKQAYQEALRIDSDYSMTYNNLGNIYARQNLMEEAEKNYYQALRLDPNYLAARINLAKLLSRKGDNQEAEKHFRYIAERDPRNLSVILELSGVLYKLERLEEAMQAYQYARQLNPYLPEDFDIFIPKLEKSELETKDSEIQK